MFNSHHPPPQTEDILFIFMKPFELLKVQSKMDLGRQYEYSFEKSGNCTFENFIFQAILQKYFLFL